MIGSEWLYSQGACYSKEALQELFPQERTLQEVLTLEDGPWAEVSWSDRLWVATHYLISARMVLMVATYLKEVALAPDSVWSDPYCLKSQKWIYNYGVTIQGTLKDLFKSLFRDKTSGLPIILRYLP